ncbi:MAG: hypothetical protein DRP03_00895 [Candidatus Aenigmatarchaeota archaeon]|nr:MAG: hypothetical protein DRP03_00895 [Candidatus Aenigmarchaeota archaeon]
MERGKYLVFALLAVLLISGCVQQGTTTGSGIVINTFEPALKSVESGEEVSLHLEVQNTGDYTDAPVVAELTGIDLSEWNVIDRYKNLGSLLAPDKDAGTEGGRAGVDWRITAPSLRRGQRLTYEPIARVYYLYKTIATKPVWFVTTEELKKIVRVGGTLESEPTTVTAGPLNVEIKTGRFVRSTDWRDTKFQLQIHIENIGNGYVAGKDYPLFIEVKWPNGVAPVGECPTITYEAAGELYKDVPASLTRPSFGRVVKLWNGRDVDLTCEFRIIEPPTNKEKRNFEVEIGYIYYVDAKTSIEVVGTEEFL